MYHEVWQTWHLRRPHANPATTSAASAAPATSQLRHRVQLARVERRWSVAALAEQARCDATALAAYERGDDVLSAEQQRRVRAALQL